MSAVFAFLHHLAAFALVAAVVVEFVLTRGEITATDARRIVAADAVLGATAGTLLVVGLLRVFFFEKGAAYYWSSGPFLAKLATFVILAILSIYPTREFLSWRAALRAGQAPALDPSRVARIRSRLHWEIIGIVAILLFAALMARGIGTLW
jgi:putative membrane protein